MPIFEDEEGVASRRLPIGSAVKFLGIEDILDELEHLHYIFSGRAPLFELLTQYFPTVCPIVFFDGALDNFLQWESAAKEYSVLPYGGGLLDQPLYVIEAFRIIRDERNRYYAVKDQRIKEKQSAAQKLAAAKQKKKRKFFGRR